MASVIVRGFGQKRGQALLSTGLTHKTKETGFLAGDFADEIEISRSETRFLRKS